MKLQSILEYIVDNSHNSPGATPKNMDVHYFGTVVQMKPSTFLALAAPLTEDPSVAYFRERIKNGEGFGSPMLFIEVPSTWKYEEYDDAQPVVRSHEGRNRMKAIMAEEGDDPVTVHIFLESKDAEWRARDITPEIKALVNKGARAESSKTFVEGPLF